MHPRTAPPAVPGTEAPRERGHLVHRRRFRCTLTARAQLLLLLLLLVMCSTVSLSSQLERHTPITDGWQLAPRGRFPYLVSIRGRYRNHHCTGAVISDRFVLTSAYCVDDVGPNPIVAIGSYGVHDDRRTEGVQEQRVEMALRHPWWSKDVEKGYDAALLRLPHATGATIPKLADRTFDAYPNLATIALTLGDALRVAYFRVVTNAVCPFLKGMVSDMICIYSFVSPVHSGDSGAPVLLADSIDGELTYGSDGQTNDGRDDLIVGLVSYANYSSLDDSGVGVVPIARIRDWINNYIPKKDEAPREDRLPFLLAMLTLVLICLTMSVDWRRWVIGYVPGSSA